MARSLGELAAAFGCELIGDPGVSVSRVATLANATGDCITFLANRAYRSALVDTSAGAVIVTSADADACPVPVLVAKDPYLVYARIAAMLHPEPPVVPGVHASAVVDATATISPDAEVAAHVTIGPQAVIGPRAFVGPGSVVGRKCRVGADSRLTANVTLYRDVILGERCVIHPGAVIGADGFGNAKSNDAWIKVPQLGGVVIGNDVEIGANSTVDRGTIDDTVIEDGVRLDNLVQIAHNVRVGAHTAMAAMAGVSGSTTIGKRCLLAGQSGIVGHITICDDVVIGGATMVTKDIVEPGFYAASFPAERDRDWKRQVARFRRLEDLAARVRELEMKANDDDE